MRTSAALIALAAVASQVSATIYITSPVASTTCTAGQTCQVSWNDDGNIPVLSTIGVCDIWLATGGQQQQTLLQNVGTDDVSQTAGVTFVPSANVGPNGADYFIKFISRTFMDPANPTFPYAAYSAKFTLAGMTGTFNATIMSQISGAVAAATTSTPISTAAIVTTSAAATAKGATTSAHATTSAKSSTATSGAVTMSVPGVVSSVTGLAVFTSFMSLFLGMLAFGF